MEYLPSQPASQPSESPIESPTREGHRASALRRLTESPELAERCSEEGKAALGRRRRAAGRCGGQFVVEWEDGRPTYRYAWPDQTERFIDQLVAWAGHH